ncbi:MAG TPA: low molecular weight protein-tyrosine-phosphatase [Lysobacter sp.]|nr:low molecular weight protein-tyrosine-phosphatase [Lysobacter sp.]
MSARLLIVCKGNICRSPMAEVLLRERLANTNLNIESAGLAAMRGAPIDPRAEASLQRHGLTAASHVGRQANKQMLQQSDLVLAMEQRQVAAVLALCPTLRGRVLMLSHWVGGEDIEDPYGRRQEVFDAAFDRIDECVRAWHTKL